MPIGEVRKRGARVARNPSDLTTTDDRTDWYTFAFDK